MKNKSLLTKVLAFFVCFGFIIHLDAQTALTWQDRGPNNNAGPVRAVLFDQQDALGKTLYAGALNGGIWKTVNQGLFWEKINLAGSNLAVSCMIQASDNKIYAGTGIYYDDQKASLRVKGSGLYVSTDGENFTLVEGTNGTGWEYINAIAVDNQNRLYAATPAGLKYRDAGTTTWQVASGTIEGEPTTFNGLAYDVKAAQSGLVLTFVDGKAYTSSNQGPTGFVCQSLKEKNGAEWVSPTKLSKNDVSRMSFAIAPQNENIVYASAATGVGSLEGIYYSQNGGIDWYVVLPFTTGSWNIFAGSGTNYGQYNNQVIVDPSNADRVIVGCVNMYAGLKMQDTGYYHWNGGAISFSSDPTSDYYIHAFHNNYTFHPTIPHLMAIASDGGVTISRDAAESFTTVNKLLGVAHIRTLAVDNYDNILAGTFGNGVQFMNAASGNPANGTEVFDGLLSGNAGNLLMSQISGKMFFMTKSASVGTATYDDFQRSDDHGLSFSATFKDAAMTTGVELMPMVVQESYFDETSTDSVRFAAIKKYHAGDMVMARSAIDRFPFPYTFTEDMDSLDTRMIIDPVMSRYFFGWKDKLYMSMNMLVFSEIPEWWKVATADGNITAIAYSKGAEYVYFGTNVGTVYRLKNVANARTAEQASMDSAQYIITVEQIAVNPNSSITSIAADLDDNNNLIYTLKSDDAMYANKLVYRTTNATAAVPSFISIHGNLPNVQVNAALIEMNGNMAMIGTQNGLYYSSNIGAGEWTKENAMGTVPVTKLIQQTMKHPGLYAVEAYKPGTNEILSGTYYEATTNYGVIYAATYGRGVWSSNNFVGLVDQPIIENTNVKSLVSVNPNPVSDKLNISIRSNFAGIAVVSVYDLKGQMVIQKEVEITSRQPISVNCAGLNRGTYMVRITGDQLDASQKFVVIK